MIQSPLLQRCTADLTPAHRDQLCALTARELNDDKDRERIDAIRKTFAQAQVDGFLLELIVLLARRQLRRRAGLGAWGLIADLTGGHAEHAQEVLTRLAAPLAGEARFTRSEEIP